MLTSVSPPKNEIALTLHPTFEYETLTSCGLEKMLSNVSSFAENSSCGELDFSRLEWIVYKSKLQGLAYVGTGAMSKVLIYFFRGKKIPYSTYTTHLCSIQQKTHV